MQMELSLLPRLMSATLWAFRKAPLATSMTFGSLSFDLRLEASLGGRESMAKWSRRVTCASLITLVVLKRKNVCERRRKRKRKGRFSPSSGWRQLSTSLRRREAHCHYRKCLRKAPRILNLFPRRYQHHRLNRRLSRQSLPQKRKLEVHCWTKFSWQKRLWRLCQMTCPQGRYL